MESIKDNDQRYTNLLVCDDSNIDITTIALEAVPGRKKCSIVIRHDSCRLIRCGILVPFMMKICINDLKMFLCFIDFYSNCNTHVHKIKRSAIHLGIHTSCINLATNLFDHINNSVLHLKSIDLCNNMISDITDRIKNAIFLDINKLVDTNLISNGDIIKKLIIDGTQRLGDIINEYIPTIHTDCCITEHKVKPYNKKWKKLLYKICKFFSKKRDDEHICDTVRQLHICYAYHMFLIISTLHTKISKSTVSFVIKRMRGKFNDGETKSPFTTLLTSSKMAMKQQIVHIRGIYYAATCQICFDAQSSILLPCGHIQMCKLCENQWRKDKSSCLCPFCNRRYNKHQQHKMF